jgi:hypothetical protein
MYTLRLLCSVILTLILIQTHGQDTLPKVSAKNIDGRIIISWRNNYAKPIANISIQRSFDSLKNYTTIGTVLNPQNKENGFADVKPPYIKMYYRIFVAFEGGSYVYTNITRPVKDTSRNIPVVVTTITMPEPPKPIGWVASKRIFTNKENVVIISLPDIASRKYSVKVYDENDKLAFELKKIPETYLTLEKGNFFHAGWFFFELYDDGVLVEKNRFYVARDGKNQVVPPPPGEQGKKNKTP